MNSAEDGEEICSGELVLLRTEIESLKRTVAAQQHQINQLLDICSTGITNNVCTHLLFVVIILKLLIFSNSTLLGPIAELCHGIYGSWFRYQRILEFLSASVWSGFFRGKVMERI